MESGYYSELETLASAPLCLSETLGPYSEGLAQRNRVGKGRNNSSGRRKREFISDEKKDATYWEKRRKNNEAAKRSREKRRISDLVLENQVLALNEENVRLKSELLALKLRFGLITTAGYAVKSQQLAGASMSSYYSAYSNGPSSLLNSDSSEAEHSSRGSGSAAGSKYSPRGSLSDISDVSSSARDSPELAMHRDVKQDEFQDLLKEAEKVRASYRGGCDDIEFIGYKDPAKCNPGPRDVAQQGPPGGTQHPQIHTSRVEDLSPSPTKPQPNQVGPRAGYTQLAIRGVSAKALTIGGLSEALSPSALAQLHAPDLSGPGAHRVKGHPFPKPPAVNTDVETTSGHPVIGGQEQVPPSQRPPGEGEDLKEASARGPEGEPAPCRVPRGFPTKRREGSPFAPCSVIEPPRGSR
eukprot:g23316.t1